MTTATIGVEYGVMATQGDRAAEGRALRKRRERLGMSQSELSVAADVGLRTLERIEEGSGGHTRIDRVVRALDRLERNEDPKAVLVRKEIAPGVFVQLEVDESIATVSAVRRGEEAVRRLSADG